MQESSEKLESSLEQVHAAQVEEMLQEELMSARERAVEDESFWRQNIADTPEARQILEEKLVWWRTEDGVKDLAMNNFHNRLPGRRVQEYELDQRLFSNASPEYTTEDEVEDWELVLSEPRGGNTRRFMTKTWRKFYEDVDGALHKAGFSEEEMVQLRDNDFQHKNMARIFGAYKILRKIGYNWSDLSA